MGGCCEVHATARAQTDAIVKLAIEKFQHVPVLVITKSREEAEAMHRCVCACVCIYVRACMYVCGRDKGCECIRPPNAFALTLVVAWD